MAYVYDQANKQKLLVSAFQQHLYSVMVPVGAGMVPVPVGAGAGKMMPLAYFCQVNQKFAKPMISSVTNETYPEMSKTNVH